MNDTLGPTPPAFILALRLTGLRRVVVLGCMLVTGLLHAPSVAQARESAPVFRFSLSIEPNGADPARIGSSESNYFLVNVLRGLYFVDAKGVPQPEIAKSCKWITAHTKIRCELKKAKWSDGKPIRAIDFVESWRRILAPTTKGFGVTILSSVKNARNIYNGSSPAESLGAKAVSDRVLDVTLESEDPEFLDRLAHPALVATRTGFSYDRAAATRAPFSGPYRIVEWKSEGRIRLENNPNYDAISKSKFPRPPVEVMTVDDDEAAFNLYREGTLTFLRRLPTHYLKSWGASSELFQIPVARFDYLGFGPGLRAEKDFRQALAHALNYQELKTIYSALGIPGCPGIDPQWMTSVPCIEFDLERAKAEWKAVSPELKSKRWTLAFSRLGGDDVQKGMEWMQQQWKKNLGLTVELKPVEQTTYLNLLRTDPPDLFRKGVGLDRSTCLAAVEIFAADNPENFIKLNDPEYMKAVEALRNSKTDVSRKQACTEVVKQLVSQAQVIPLGRIHFSMLAKPKFTGWVLNPLNHLDLSHLHANP